MITWAETKKIIYVDVYRNLGECTKLKVIKECMSYGSTVGLLVFFRICHYYAELEKKNIFQKIIHALFYYQFKKKQVICGIEINQHTKIGFGLRLPHRGNIVIHPMVVIGNNCEIMQGVTLGNNILKDRNGVPVIGDDVLICSGAKIIGKVKIGNGSIVGANSVVNKNIDENVIVGGVPAKYIKNSNDVHVINKYTI